MIPLEDLIELISVTLKKEYVDKAIFAYSNNWDEIFHAIHLDALYEMEEEDCKLQTWTDKNGVTYKVIIYYFEWPKEFMNVIYTCISETEFKEQYNSELGEEMMKVL
jgi:hypothetical protein